MVSEFGRRREAGRHGVIYFPTLRSGAECLSNRLAMSCHAAARKRSLETTRVESAFFSARKKLYLFASDGERWVGWPMGDEV